MAKKVKSEDKDETGKPQVWGDPDYGAKDDIYSREERKPLKDSDDDPEDGSVGDADAATGEGLDVPGSELDDSDEKIGEEDEENNYYSLGGDDHDDLEEDRGE